MKYSQLLIEAGKKQALICNNDSFTYINCLVTCEGMRQLMKTVYYALIAEKYIPTIESLTVVEKNTLWEQTKDFAKGALEKPELIKLAQSLYSIEYFLTQ